MKSCRRLLFMAIGVSLCFTIDTLWRLTTLSSSFANGISHRRSLATYGDVYIPPVMAAPISFLPETTNPIAIRVVHNETVPSGWRPCQLIHSLYGNMTDDETLEPISYRLDNHVATFLHVGKTAGGTAVERAVQCWRTFFKACHPRPCPRQIDKLEASKKLHNMNNNNHDTKANVIITLRDPIDRFVSSFYWRILVVCHPYDKRKRNKGAANNPRRYCARPLDGERRALQYYDRNASRLAESLCAVNATERALAEQNLQRIQHAAYGLDQWLNFSWSPDHLFPIVTESNLTSVEAQTDRAMEWLYSRTAYESRADFAQRQRFARQRHVTGNAATHSSRRYKQPLMPEAEQCLAQYLKRDYEILKELERRSVCKTDDCRMGLRSILQRRSHLLSVTA